MGIAIPSIILFAFILAGIVCAWKHMFAHMLVCIMGAMAVAVFCDTALSPLFAPSVSQGMDRVMEVGPAFILGASLVAGYWSAVRHNLSHVLLCLGLAATSIVLGW